MLRLLLQRFSKLMSSPHESALRPRRAGLGAVVLLLFSLAPLHQAHAIDTVYDAMDQIPPWQLGGTAAGATVLAVSTNVSTTGLGSINLATTFSDGATYADLYWDNLGSKDFSQNVFQVDFRTSVTNAFLKWRLEAQTGQVYEAAGYASSANTFTNLKFFSSNFSGVTENIGAVKTIILQFVGDAVPGKPALVDMYVDNFRIDAYRNISTGNWAPMTNEVSGTGGLLKEGGGRLNFESASTYTGPTTVAAGELQVNGSISNSAVSVADGAKLSGVGLVGSTTIGSGATISPGNSPGELTINGDLTWGGGGSYDWEILSLADGPGTGWDLIAVGDELLFSSLSSTNKFNINLFSLSGANTAGALANFNYATNYSWKILAATNNIAGFSAGDFSLNTGGFTAYNDLHGGFFSIAVDGGDLNLLYNPSSAVPEPGTWAAGLLLVATAVLIARHRKSSLA